ncbi:flippase, partial [Candidatus Uhrbacteria bacterium]|nr:flippase [Candidatus Uhrbacteria bacterium]
TYFLALSITTMVGVIADFGLTSVLVRDSAKRPEHEGKLLGNVLSTKIAFTALAILVAVIMAHAFGYDILTRYIIYAACLVMVLDTVHLTLYGVLRARHTLRIESIGIFLGQLITLVVGVGSLLIEPNLLWLIVALFAGSSWNVGFIIWQLKKSGVSRIRFTWDTAFIKTLLKTSWPFALAAIFVKIYSTTDSLLLNAYLGAVHVGIYSVAYKLTYSFQFFPLAFIAALYPTLSAHVAQKRQDLVWQTFEHATQYLILLATPIVFGLWAIADALIPAIYSDAYVDAVLPFRTLIFVLVLIFLDFPIGALLNADDHQRLKTAIMGGTMIVNVVANIVLIPRFGVVGACMAAVIAFIFLYGAGLYALHALLHYDIKRVLRIVGPVLLCGVLMALVVLLVKPLVGWITSIPIGAAVYVAGLLLTHAITIEQLKTIRARIFA